MNTYMSQLTTTVPRICSTWEMIYVMSDSRLKPNSNRHYLNFDTKYDISAAYGQKYVKEPYLDYIRFGKLVKRYSLEEFINMMNFWDGGDSTYIDSTGQFVFSNCIKYSQFPSRIYANIEEYIKAFSTIGDVTDVNSLYAYTNYKFSNIKSTTRNAIGCFDDVKCIINYCHDKGQRWMYDPNTQMCYYPIDFTVVPSDDKMFFAN